MKKSKLCKAIAMAAALGGLGAGLYASTASAVNLSPTGVGDVVLFPYYTVRDGWQTTLTFVNTSNEFLAVKFRFMEGYNSRDVLDFNVVMSPFDVYTGVVEAGNGTAGDKTSGVRFRIPALETTCTAPYLAPDSSFGLSPVAYAGSGNVNADGGPTTNDRLREGYVMAMVMGHANRADLAAIVADTNGVIPTTAALRTAAATLLLADHANAGNTSAAARATQCTAVQNLFATANFTAGSLTTPRLFGEPINALKGNYSLLNVERGTSAGGNAVILSNFFNMTAGTDFVRPAAAAGSGQANLGCNVAFSAQFNYNAYVNLNPLPPAPAAWAPVIGNGTNVQAPGGCPNLLTPQVFPYFLEPSLNNVYSGAATGTASALSNVTGALEPAYASYALSGFQAVSEVLRARTASNEWSVNPNLGVATNWVVTHPTKSFFVDDPTHSSTTAVAVPPFVTPATGANARADVVQAAINQARFFTNPGDPAWLPVRPALNYVAGQNTSLNPFPASFSATTASAGKSCVNVGVNIWDRDELSAAAGGVTPSPIEPTAQRQLCYETNVFNFNPNGQTVFGSKLTTDLSEDVEALWAQATVARPAQPFGWLQLNFAVDLAAQGGIAAGVAGPLTSAAGTTLAGPGLPAIGFMMRERIIDTINVRGNYGDLANHSYTR